MAYTTVKSLLTAICDSIRGKDGTTALIDHQDIPSRITAITAKLQQKSVTPTETEQTISPDSGYDGLSSVSVEAISKTYVGSGVTKKATATYTPGTSDQTIASGIYLSGTQTIKGDANLIASNIKDGVPIFGVTGSYSGGSGDTTLNCEACIIDVTNPVVDFKGTGGTIKAWGYAKGPTSGYTTPKYGFIGTQYSRVASYGNDTTTDMTLSVDSSGNLTGLPSLNSGTLLITRGI